MFRAFIVDDDQASAKVASLMFPWEELCISKIDEIYTTTGLVERILDEHPDIVFIDIEMGEISGLDIIKSCKSHECESLFIIMSGHDNFDYAQTAINLGAIHYLLKPIEYSDVAVLTQKLKKILHKTNVLEISDYLSNKNNFNSYLMNKLNDGDYRFLICSLSNEQKVELDMFFQDTEHYCFKIGKKKHLYILPSKIFGPKTLQQLNAFALQQSINIGISKLFNKNSNMHEHFLRTNQLSYQHFLQSKGGLLIDPVSSNTTVLKNTLDNLFRAIDEKHLQQMEAIMKELPHLFAKQTYTMEHVMWFYKSLITRINIIYNQSIGFTFSQMDEEDIYTHFQNFTNLCDCLLDYFKETISPDIDQEENSNEIWNKILEYIEKNYNKKIQAQDICKDLYICERTFYYVFKANSNNTFVDYLTRFRIEKAKKLLLTSAMTIPEIAETIGIKDHYYFNKVFKKHTGLTPLKFKNEGGDHQIVQEDED